jgi:hypothetical protein
MLDWTVIVPTFLAAAVEWVKAFTIVLASQLEHRVACGLWCCRNSLDSPDRRDGRDRWRAQFEA